MANYIFIITNLEIGDKIIEHSQIVKKLFQEKEWIFPKKGVPNLNRFQKGDRVILYIAGLGNRHFYGTFKLNGTIRDIESYPEEFYQFFSKKIDIADINLLDKKLYMKDIKDELEFIKDKKNYGLHLRQSVRAINDNDYNLILKKYTEL